MKKAGFVLFWRALAMSVNGEEITCTDGICTAQPTAAPTAAGNLGLYSKDTITGDCVVAGVGVRTKGTGNGPSRRRPTPYATLYNLHGPAPLAASGRPPRKISRRSIGVR